MRRAHDTPSTERAERGEQRSASRSTAAPANAVLAARGLSSLDGLGNRATLALWRQGALQRKPRLSEPGDALEHEADRAADAVLSGDRPEHLSRHDAGGDLQRAATDDQQLAATLGLGPNPEEAQPRNADATQAADAAATPSGGDALDDGTRSLMESRFGEDFSGVRVHSDTRAGQAAEAVRARAFTVGDDIVFGEGNFAPQTSEGQHLLAHELAHVVQQRSAVSSPSDTKQTERDARDAADEVASGGVATVRERAAPGSVQKDDDKARSLSAWWEGFPGEDWAYIVVDNIKVAQVIAAGKIPITVISVSATEYGKDFSKLSVAVAVAQLADDLHLAQKRWKNVHISISQVPNEPPEPEPPEPKPDVPKPVPVPVPKPKPKPVPPKQQPKPQPTPNVPSIEPEPEPPTPEPQPLPFKFMLGKPAVTTLRDALANDSAKVPEAASHLSDTDLAELNPEERLGVLRAIADHGSSGDAATLLRLMGTTPPQDKGSLLDSLNADNGKLLGDLRAKLPQGNSFQFEMSLLDLSMDRSNRSLFAPPDTPAPQFDLAAALKGPMRDSNDIVWVGDPSTRPSWTKGMKVWTDDRGNTNIWTADTGLTSWNREGKRLGLEHPDLRNVQRAIRGMEELARFGGKRFVEGKGLLDEAQWHEYVEGQATALGAEADRSLGNLAGGVDAWKKTQQGDPDLALLSTVLPVAALANPGTWVGPAHLLGGRSTDDPAKILRSNRQDVQIALKAIRDAHTPTELAEAKQHLAFAMGHGSQEFYQYKEDVFVGGERTITTIKVGAVAATAVVAAPAIFTTLGGATVVTIGGKAVVVGGTALGSGLLTGTMGGALESTDRGLSWENYGKGFADYAPVGFSYGAGFGIGGVLGPSTSLLRGAAIDASVSGTTGMVDRGLHGGSFDESLGAGGESFVTGGGMGLFGRGLGLKSLPLRVGVDVGSSAGVAYLSGADSDEIYRQALLAGSLGLGGGLGEQSSAGSRKGPGPAWEQWLQSKSAGLAQGAKWGLVAPAFMFTGMGGMGGMPSARSRPLSKAGAARLGEHFTPGDLQALDQFLKRSGRVPNDAMVGALIDHVPPGSMADALKSLEIAEARAAQTGVAPELGPGSGMNVIGPRGSRQTAGSGSAGDPPWRMAEKQLQPVLENTWGPGWEVSPRKEAPGARPGETLGSTVPEYYNPKLKKAFEVKRLDLADLGVGTSGQVSGKPSQASVEAIGRARRQLEGRQWVLPAGTEQNIVFNITGQGVKDGVAVGKQLRALLEQNLIKYDRVYVQDGNTLTEIK